jgi:hypothetical protein
LRTWRLALGIAANGTISSVLAALALYVRDRPDASFESNLLTVAAAPLIALIFPLYVGAPLGAVVLPVFAAAVFCLIAGSRRESRRLLVAGHVLLPVAYALAIPFLDQAGQVFLN